MSQINQNVNNSKKKKKKKNSNSYCRNESLYIISSENKNVTTEYDREKKSKEDRVIKMKLWGRNQEKRIDLVVSRVEDSIYLHSVTLIVRGFAIPTSTCACYLLGANQIPRST